MVTVTVFTPTYNRKHTLERAYRSLQRQSFRDFEWLIVDDGSTDETRSLVVEWQKENDIFPIRYQWKPNGGKHTAHNLGISLARGKYFAILDSDDWYDPEALMALTSQWESMPAEEKEKFSNIEGLCRHEDGTMIGEPYPLDICDSDNVSVRKTMKRPADTMGMYRLAVLKEYPFPDNFNGSFVPESLVWDRIAEQYKTRFMNTTIGFKEYQQGGLTRRSLSAGFRKSEPAVLYYREQSRRKTVGPAQKVKCKTNVYRYSFHNRLPILKQLKEETFAASGIPFAFLGYLVYMRDRMAIFIETLTKPRE